MTVELVLVHEVKQDEASDFRDSDKEEAVEPGALGVRVAGDDDNVEDGGDDAAHALAAHEAAHVLFREGPQDGGDAALEDGVEDAEEH